jgi:hypothetical protein
MKIATAPVSGNNNDIEYYRQWTPYAQLLEDMVAADYAATQWDVSMEKDAGKMLADSLERLLEELKAGG